MSVVYTDSTEIVKHEINRLLEQGLKISGEYINTYDLYGTDNKLLLSVEKHKKDFAGPTYSVRLSNFGFNEKIDIEPNWHIENFYFRVKPLFDKRNPELKSIVDIKWTVQDSAELYAEHRKSPDYNQMRLIMDLIFNLYKARCPIDRIQKIIYYFDKPNSKHKFHGDFETLNHDNKLVEYETPRKHDWFFSGENYSLSFSPMDEQSQEIFDMVKNALKNQKQNVK